MSATHGSSTYGRLFWSGVVLGWVVIAFGIVSALTHWRSANPPQLFAWLIGLALVHDLAIAPVVSLAGRALARGGRRGWVGTVEAALVVSGSIALFAIPFVAGWGRQAGNPSLLPRNYARGLLVILVVIWAVTAAVLLRRARRSGERRTNPSEAPS